MGLREKIEAKECRTKSYVLDGDTYLLKTLSTRVYMSLYAKARNNKGVFDNPKFERLLLSNCVFDPDGTPVYPEAEHDKWGNAPAYLTVPLVSECLKFNGYEEPENKDNADPKDSGSTPS